MATQGTGLSGVWFPLFEFQDFAYRSILLKADATLPGTNGGGSSDSTIVDGKIWAQGKLMFGQAFRDGESYRVSGTLALAPGVELAVNVEGNLRAEGKPATFRATGTSDAGATKGAEYELVGWVWPEEQPQAGAARVKRICGAIRAVRGADAKPEIELGGMPLGTVGLFKITQAT